MTDYIRYIYSCLSYLHNSSWIYFRTFINVVCIYVQFWKTNSCEASLEFRACMVFDQEGFDCFPDVMEEPSWRRRGSSLTSRKQNYWIKTWKKQFRIHCSCANYIENIFLSKSGTWIAEYFLPIVILMASPNLSTRISPACYGAN